MMTNIQKAIQEVERMTVDELREYVVGLGDVECAHILMLSRMATNQRQSYAVKARGLFGRFNELFQIFSGLSTPALHRCVSSFSNEQKLFAELELAAAEAEQFTLRQWRGKLGKRNRRTRTVIMQILRERDSLLRKSQVRQLVLTDGSDETKFVYIMASLSDRAMDLVLQALRAFND